MHLDQFKHSKMITASRIWKKNCHILFWDLDFWVFFFYFPKSKCGGWCNPTNKNKKALVGLHFPPHFDFRYSKEKKLKWQTNLAYHTKYSVCIKHTSTLTRKNNHCTLSHIMCLKSHWISTKKNGVKNFYFFPDHWNFIKWNVIQQTKFGLNIFNTFDHSV